MESQTAYKLLFAEYPDVVNVEQMCEMLGGICDKTAYRLLKSGKIKSFIVGRRYRIPKLNILEYLDLIENLLRKTSFAHLADVLLSATILLSMADGSALYQSKEVLLW